MHDSDHSVAGIPANAGDWLAAVERIFNKAATKNTTKYVTPMFVFMLMVSSLFCVSRPFSSLETDMVGIHQTGPI